VDERKGNGTGEKKSQLDGLLKEHFMR